MQYSFSHSEQDQSSSCSKIRNCFHQRIKKSKARKNLWLNPTSDAFKALQSIVLDQHILGGLNYLTKFYHTGILEIFYALLNKWIPKHLYLSRLGMVTRSQLVVMDFNSGSNLPQAKTKSGQGKYKITKKWSSKPMKAKKDETNYFEMIDRTV